METSKTQELNTEIVQTEKNKIGTYTVMAAPAVIGAWATACLIGLVVAQAGPVAWNLLS